MQVLCNKQNVSAARLQKMLAVGRAKSRRKEDAQARAEHVSSPREKKRASRTGQRAQQQKPFLFFLKKNGDEVEVTQDNREEYILLLCKWLLKTSCLFSLTSFCAGFHSVLDSSATTLRFLSPKLLDHMLCGTTVGWNKVVWVCAFCLQFRLRS